MKRFLMTTAIAAFASMPAVAQQQDASQGSSNQSGSSAFMEGGSVDLAASNLMGRTVYIGSGGMQGGDQSGEAQTASSSLQEADGEASGSGMSSNGSMQIADASETDWEEVGEIGDILLSRDGQVEAVVIDAGGFLGLGERQVAIRMDQLQFVNDSDDEGEYFLMISGDRSMIESAPEFDMASVGAWAAGAAQATENAAEDVAQSAENAGENLEQATENAAEETAQATENAAENVEQTAENAGENLEQATENAAEETAQATENAAENVEQTAENAGENLEQATENAAEETAQATENAAENVEQTAENAAASAEQTAEEAGQVAENAAENTEQAIEGTAQDAEQLAEGVEEEVDGGTVRMTEGAPAGETGEMGEDGQTEMAQGDQMSDESQQQMAQGEGNLRRPQIEREGWTSTAAAELTADDLTGADLYDANDEQIGEVSDLILDENGRLTQAILDVGGFLGLGEHSVAIPMDSLEVQRADNSGEFRVYVDATENDLEAMPEYEDEM